MAKSITRRSLNVLGPGTDVPKNSEGPFEERFPDKFDKVCAHHVAVSFIVSNYFNYSNCVSMQNPCRQFDLALKKS